MREKPEVRRRVLCFLLSVVVHAVLAYLLINAFPPLKVVVYERKVTEVVIAPAEKLFVPKSQEYFSGLDDFTLNTEEKALRRTPGYSESAEKREGEGPGQKVRDKIEAVTFNPDLSSGFRLDKPLETSEDLSKALRLALPLLPEKKESHGVESDKEIGKKYSGLLKYMYPAYSNIRSSQPGPYSARTGRGTSLRGQRVSFHGKGYDLTTWAASVVDRIQKNWLIAPPGETSAKGAVTVSVTIEKNGELSLVSILSSSNIRLFDQIAVEAIQLSSPFPSLPDDFPFENLEVYFVFEYND